MDLFSCKFREPLGHFLIFPKLLHRDHVRPVAATDQQSIISVE